MFKRNHTSESDERLDRAGRAIVRAASANDSEAEAVAASPFLYTRLRARINAEREKREMAGGWLTLLAMRRAIMAMSLVAFMSLGLLWFASGGVVDGGGNNTAQAYSSFSDAAFFDEPNAGVERVMFAERGTLSNDDVMATIINEDQEASK